MTSPTKILFICSKNLWRSPTAERVYCNDPRLAVRSRGLSPKAARRISPDDLRWADVVFVMEYEHLAKLRSLYRNALGQRPVHVLEIPDKYQFMDPKLVKLIQEGVESFLSESPVE
ncbi:low molecular weight protein tyrosine phosphatase family protein [Bremerella sp. P1]|uniref:low molecular weight protein tyrosine phosphatase family protein n=1 Tax=Bremerella sp. P1 TaxID=3026424 RepID=UPI0023682A5F|nr:protein tyrosine phosphatase [Bremerella sp. P1]WDI43316.1 protein tyrosine phosphatase [Bremerella sp. P1]